MDRRILSVPRQIAIRMLFLACLPFGVAGAQHCDLQETLRFDANPLLATGNGVALDGVHAAVVTTTSAGLSALDFFEFDGVDWSFDLQVACSLQGARSVDLSGDFAVVGVPFDSTILMNQGAAVLFSRVSGTWVEEVVLRDPNAKHYDQFGSAVALDGSVLVIGAIQGNGPLIDSGTAVVYRFDGSAWVFEATLAPAELLAYDLFGFSAAVDGDVITVGAKNYETDRGAAWIYRFDGLNWVEEQRIQPTELADFDNFSEGLALHGDVIISGSPGFDDPLSGVNQDGAAFVFRHDGSTWMEETRLNSSGTISSAEFGERIALAEGVAVIGAPASPGGQKKGRAFVFQDVGGGRWIEWTALSASDSQTNDWFGAGLAIDDTWIWVAAPADGNAVYVYPNGTSIPGLTACNGSGVNPLCLGSITVPALGTDWSATIDTSGHPGAGLTALVAFDKSSFGVISAFGELLVAPEALGGTLVFSSLAQSIGGSAIHTLSIPGDSALIGLVVYVQGVILGGTGPALCNALDLIVGL